ncbi:MAG: PAS domain-containing sensor histidine kinase [Candidatus Zixiibacteriota bacterium]
MTATVIDQTTNIRRCAMCKIDRKGRFILANPEAQKLLGLSEVELFGKPFIDFLQAADRQSYLNLIKNRNPYDAGYDSACVTMIGADGQAIPVTLFVAVNFGGGNPANYQVVIRQEEVRLPAVSADSKPEHWEEIIRLLVSETGSVNHQRLIELLLVVTGVKSVAVYEISDTECRILAAVGDEPIGLDLTPLPSLEQSDPPCEVRATFSLEPGRNGLVRFILDQSLPAEVAAPIRGRTEIAANLVHAARPPIHSGSTDVKTPAPPVHPSQILDHLSIGYIAFDDFGKPFLSNQTFESLLNPSSMPATLQQLVELVGARCGESAAMAVDGYLSALATCDCLPSFKATYDTLDSRTLTVEVLPFESQSEKPSCCFLFYEPGSAHPRPVGSHGVSPHVGTTAIELLRSTVTAALSVWQKLEHEHHNQLSRDGGFYLGCLSHHLAMLEETIADLDRMLRLIGDEEEPQVVDLGLLVSRVSDEIGKNHPGLSFSVRHTDLSKVKTRLRKITAVLYDVLAVATQSGIDRKTEVTVTTSVESGICTIWIRDNGPGLNSRQKKTIFTIRRSFAQDKTRRPGGLTVGLALAREIVTGMGGALELETRPGKGTIIKITFPIVQG